MPLARILRDHALTLSASLKKDLAELALEKQGLKVGPKSKDNITRLKHVGAKIRKAQAGIARLQEYNPEIQRPFDCPYCWIIEGTRIRLQPAERRILAVTCPSCTAEYELNE